MKKGEKIKIVVVDDHGIVREGLTKLLQAERDLSVIGEAGDGKQAMDVILKLCPDLAIVNLHMPGILGTEVIRRVRKSNRQVRLAVLTISDDVRSVEEAFRVGANAYISKMDPPRQLIEAIRIIMDGGVYISPRLQPQALLADAGRLAPAYALSNLSAREYQVFGFLVGGCAVKDIAASLGIKPKSVNAHRSNLMRKLHIHDVPGLVRYAVQHKLK